MRGTTRQFHSLKALLALALFCSALAGCDAAVTLENAPPRVTWVAVQPPQDGVSVLAIWLLDLEGDRVDLEMTWSGEGLDGDHAAVPASNGHGRVGLMTKQGRQALNGQAHELAWNVDDVPVDQQVRLSFTPTDHRGDTGETVITPAFILQDGLPEPVPFPVESQ